MVVSYGALRTRIFAALLFAVATFAFCAGRADAAGNTYEVWSCKGPNGENLSSSIWKFNQASGTASSDSDTCTSGGSRTISLPAATIMADSQYALLNVTAPSNTSIADYKIWRNSTTFGAGLFVIFPWSFQAQITESNQLGINVKDNCDFLSGCQGVDNRTSPFARPSSPTPTNELSMGVRCTNGWVLAGCAATTDGALPATTQLTKSWIKLVDAADPALVKVSAVKAAGTVVNVDVSASDEGAGVAQVNLSVDGVPYATRDSGGACVKPYSSLSPCPSQTDRSFPLSSGANLTPGNHKVSGTIVDGAGNVTNWGPLQVDVPSPPVPPTTTTVHTTTAPTVTTTTPGVTTTITTINPVGGPRLSLSQSSVKLSKDAGVQRRLGGGLKDASGKSIANATVTVSLKDLDANSTWEKALDPVKTDADGAFKLDIPRQSGRRIVVTYDAPSGTATAQATILGVLGLDVEAPKKPLSWRKRVHVKGVLTGAGALTEGTPILVEAVVRRQWRPVGSAVAAKNGKFVWKYKFKKPARTTDFSFRITVQAGPTWPWKTIRSDKFKIRVKP